MNSIFKIKKLNLKFTTSLFFVAMITLFCITGCTNAERKVEEKVSEEAKKVEEALKETEGVIETEPASVEQIEDTVSVVTTDYDPNLEGDEFQQNVAGNIVDGIQWKYEIQNSCIEQSDDMINFYDSTSKTEVGDFFYFFSGAKKGDEVVTFTLYDTETNKVYCKVIYYFNVDKKDGKMVMTLKKRDVYDNRPANLSKYTFDDPELRFNTGEH